MNDLVLALALALGAAGVFVGLGWRRPAAVTHPNTPPQPERTAEQAPGRPTVLYLTLPRETYAAFPDLSFWYGLTFRDLMEMPRFVLDEYAQAIPRLQANYQIMLGSAADHPHLKSESRRALDRRLESMTRQRERVVARPARPKLTRGDLAAAGIGMKVRAPRE